MHTRVAHLVAVLSICGVLMFNQSLLVADDHHAPAEGATTGTAEAGSTPTAEHHDHAASDGAAAGGHHDSRDFSKPPLANSLSLQLFLFTLVLFGGYFYIMKSTAWQPLIAGLNEREARVQRAERDAATAKAEAARFHEQAEQRMVETHGQVKEILTKARAEAESQKMQIVKNAELEATRVKEQALAEIAAARQQAVDELSSMVDSQAALASRQIAGGSFN